MPTYSLIILSNENFPRILLFFLNTAQPIGMARFGEGSGPVHFNNIGCTGNEANLLECLRDNFGSCQHDRDAGARCRPPFSGEFGSSVVGFKDEYSRTSIIWSPKLFHDVKFFRYVKSSSHS